MYYAFGDGYLNHTLYQETGWTGDTPMAIYSNSKILGVLTFMAAVIDTGLGYLDEPLSAIFGDLLIDNNATTSMVGTVTPLMIMSHTSGMATYNRNDPVDDPYYRCKYDDSTTLEDCISMHMLDDAILKSTPGTTASYANEPFDIIAAIVVRKTGMMSYGHALEHFLTKPLGMNDTSVDCSVTQSTNTKPHIAWGVCSTAHDMAKLVQVLGNNGKALDGQSRIVSPQSLHQIFSPNTGTAMFTDGILGGNIEFAYSRCYASFRYPDATQTPNSVMGYGLGTMIMPGTKGIWLTHAGSKGGYWAVAPGRFAAYFGWQDNAPYPAYSTIAASLLDTLEQSNAFYVSHKDDNGGGEEIETCGGGDLYMDWFARMGIDSIRDVTGYSCGRRQLGKVTPLRDSHSKKTMEEAMQIL